MAVLVTLQIEGDSATIETALDSDPERLQAVAERAEGKGALHHRFYASADGSAGDRRRRMGDRRRACSGFRDART